MNWKKLTKISVEAKDSLSEYSEVIQQLLFNRGISKKEECDKFFNADINDISSPESLPGAVKAAEFILEAIKNKKKIIIYGDYDVDGVSATSILFDFLYRYLHANVLPYIPDRFTEGYGLSEIGLDEAVKNGAELIITVDCGIRDSELIEKYSKKGIDFIVTDHHTIPRSKAGEYLPPKMAKAVVHPKLDDKSKFTDISGATVSWKLVAVISNQAKKIGILDKEFNINRYLDVVSLATVCDVMPLIEENRILVKSGLKQFAVSENLGLQTMIGFLNLDPNEIDVYHLGFIIGPRFNAGGRIKHAITGVKILTTQKPDVAKDLITKHEELNLYRQNITTELVAQAENKLSEKELQNKLLFVYGNDWPDGIVGLVAGKLTEKYHRPVMAGSISNGKLKGSARSVKDFHITDAIGKLDELLEKYGGHKLAAGFLLKEINIDLFKTGMQKIANEFITEEDLIPEIEIDSELNAENLNFEFLSELDNFAPFGYGNKRPVFEIKGAIIKSLKFIGQGQKHVKLLIQKGEKFLDVIAFNQSGKFENIKEGDVIDLAGTLEKNTWNGNVSLQFNCKDFKKQ